MSQYCHAAEVASPGFLLLQCLGYAHGSNSFKRWHEVIFWAAVLVAFVTVFAFFSRATAMDPRVGVPALKATLYSADLARTWQRLWSISLGLGVGGILGCVVHFVATSRRGRP